MPNNGYFSCLINDQVHSETTLTIETSFKKYLRKITNNELGRFLSYTHEI